MFIIEPNLQDQKYGANRTTRQKIKNEAERISMLVVYQKTKSQNQKNIRYKKICIIK